MSSSSALLIKAIIVINSIRVVVIIFGVPFKIIENYRKNSLTITTTAKATATRTEKSNRFRLSKQQLCTSRFFCTFPCSHCTTTTWKNLISRFEEDVNTRQGLSFSFAEFRYSHFEFHTTKICQQLTKRTRWNKHDEVWGSANSLFESDVFVVVAVVVAKLPIIIIITIHDNEKHFLWLPLTYSPSNPTTASPCLTSNDPRAMKYNTSKLSPWWMIRSPGATCEIQKLRAMARFTPVFASLNAELFSRIIRLRCTHMSACRSFGQYFKTCN